ncbi:MAG: hypothetical protein PHI35_00425 [Victivallaceae bacterium]|nr:hypothetical protein [Victivallaceae bacterium]
MSSRSLPALWVPTLYFAEGMPYILITVVSVNILASLGVGNADNALWTSFLVWPWIVKPLWAPIVDLRGSKKNWIVRSELAIAVCVLAGGLCIWQLGAAGSAVMLACFAAAAFFSATHDIAADGLYLIALTPDRQSFYSGIRNTFYRVAMISAQGGVVMLAGVIAAGFVEPGSGLAVGWGAALCAAAAVYFLLAVFHYFTLPGDKPNPAAGSMWLDFLTSFGSFFRKPGVWRMLGFLLLYRFAESQLSKIAVPFILDHREAGGLGLSLARQGFIYGTIGVVALLTGGVLGGVIVMRCGLRRMFWPFALAINLPDLVYVYLAWAMPESSLVVTLCVAIEQFGYGLGFSSYMLAMLWFASDSGRNRTGHYALMTGFMALGLALPGAIAGWIQQQLGYTGFFIWVVAGSLIGFGSVALIRTLVPQDFGRKSA